MEIKRAGTIELPVTNQWIERCQAEYSLYDDRFTSSIGK